MPFYQRTAAKAAHVIGGLSSAEPCHAGTGGYCREVPDVSAQADDTTGILIYLRGQWSGGWGGTSFSSPLWAALLALVNADSACAGTTVGFATPAMYDVAGGTGYTSAFNDITQGNNDADRAHGTLYPAGPGYDMATGLGTPIAAGGTTAKPTGLASDLCALGRSPGDVAARTASTVTASPASVAANGASFSTITVSLLTAGTTHLPVAGKSVTLTASGGSSKITAMPSGSIGRPGTTGANGVVTFEVKDTVAQKVTYGVTDTTDQVQLTHSATVTFTAVTAAHRP
jgi:subtilase family serine protease